MLSNYEPAEQIMRGVAEAPAMLRIASADFWNRIKLSFGCSGGVYRLSCLQEEGSDVITPVRRLLGDDPEGALYIGMAISFLDRVISLKKSIAPEYVSRSHECGTRHKRHASIAAAFPYERLVVSFALSDCPRTAERLELEEYCSRFGELPPLNRAG